MNQAGRVSGSSVTVLARFLSGAVCLVLTLGGSPAGEPTSAPSETAEEQRSGALTEQTTAGDFDEQVRNRTRTATVRHTAPPEPMSVQPDSAHGAGVDTGAAALDWWPGGMRPPFGNLTPLERESNAAIMVGNAAYLAHRGTPPVPPELADLRPPSEGGGYYVVHFTGPLSVREVEQLRLRGIRSAGYVPRGAWLTRLDATAYGTLVDHPRVDAIHRYQPAYKISPGIGRSAVEARREHGEGRVYIDLRATVFAGESPPAVARILRELGVHVVQATRSSPLDPGLLPDGRAKARPAAYVEFSVEAERASALLPAIARLQGVRWIEERDSYRLASDWTVSGWVYGDSRSAGADFLQVRQPWNNGLRGEGTLLGSVDSGLDFDHAYFADPAQPAFVQENPPTKPCPGDGPKNSLKVPYYHLAPPYGVLIPVCYDRNSQGIWLGHGTTTAGLMAADGTASDNVNIDLSSGLAPEAQLWLYDAGPATGAELAIDAAAFAGELEAMGQTGVTAVNLSFVEDETDGEYDFLAQLLDEAAWNQSGLVPVQAGGNDGADTGGASVYTVDATAKNVIAVGGNRDDDPDTLYPYGSRGPAIDGRYKPDVLAPADNDIDVPNANPALDETLLLLSSDGLIDSDNSGFLHGPEGTSFSCAAVTGAAGVVAQYFRDGYYPTGIANPTDGFTPPNHLVKGMVINSARRLTGAGISDPSRPGKDQGWGRATLNDPLYFSQDPDTGDDARKLVVQRGSLPQGATSCPADSEIFTFDLYNVEEELRITLSWTDYPGDHSNPFAAQIVNDLDLVVTAPDASVYLGNVFDASGSGLSVTGSSADRYNTVENVWLASGEGLSVGEYTVEVCPHAINEGVKQDFSLVITGGVTAGEKVRFDQAGYSCLDTVGIEVEDRVASGPSVDVLLASLTTGDSETVTLEDAGSTGIYSGSFETAPASGPPILENGSLEVTDGETIEVTFVGSTSRASIECTPRLCYAIDLGPVLQHECDNDGFADNDETIHLYVPLRNEAAFPLDGTTVVLTSGNPHVTVDSNTATYGTIPAGGVALPDDDGSDDPFVITVSGAACDESATLTLTTVAGSGWVAAGCSTATLGLTLNRDPVPLQGWDFDDGSPQGWTHDMTHLTRPAEECEENYIDEWNTFPTTSRSHSGDYAMQLGNGAYDNLADCSLISPSIDIPSGGARLKFHYWMEADPYDENQVWDGFIFEASSNGGASWARLDPVGGYNALAARNDCLSDFPFGNIDPDFLELFGGDGDGPLYTGDTFDREWVVDLSAYASQTVQVRFRFGSDNYAALNDGLYIDTITLEGVACETPNACDDGDECTTDTCDPDAGGCQYTAEIDGTTCDDGEACTGDDECLSGVCTGTDAISCDDGNPCTDDWVEDDGDAVCDNPATDCRHEDNTAPCDDANECTTEDICESGVCQAGPALECGDLNGCTDDSCNPASGCVYVNNTNPCGDPYSCTEVDTCLDGQCAGTPNDLLCDDVNVCTTDTCQPGNPLSQPNGCLLAPVTNGTACDDTSVCTDPDACVDGVCGGTPIVCEDGASCTDNLCDDATGCYYPGIDEDEDLYDICGDGDPVNPDGLEEDCNDDLPGVHPGMVEDCYNDLDDDCNGLIDEQDPLGCPRSDISGTAYFYRSGDVEPSTVPVPNTTLAMIGSEFGTTTTNSSGYYELLNILKGVVSVIPSKLADYGGAITSLDAARISQYRVGMITLTDWQILAGDVSGNGDLSSYDAALISQFRVGIISRFPVAADTGSDWLFVPDQRDYAPIGSDQTDQDYVAILYGDVTGNWAPPGRSAAGVPGDSTELVGPSAGKSERPACRLWLRPAGLQAGTRSPQRYVLQATGVEGLLGLDLDLRYETADVTVVSVTTTEKTRDFVLTANDTGGVLRISMYGDQPFTDSGSLLELTVERKKSGAFPRWFLDAQINEGALECVTRP